MIKTKVKFIIALAIMLLVVSLLSSNKVKAYSNEDIKIGNDIEAGLINNVELSGEHCDLELNPKKVIEMLSNNSKLNSLVQNDNMVYENVYIKLDDNETKASVIVEEKQKDLEIVTIDNNRYAKCSLGLFIKGKDTYTLTGQITGISVCGITANANHYATIKTNSRQLILTYLLPEEENGSHLYINSKTKEIKECCEGISYLISSLYDRQELAKCDDLYVTFETSSNAGNSINIVPFGKLDLVKTNNGKYTYEKQITDKTLFNKDYKGQIVMPEYNLLYLYSISFTGNLIEKEPKQEDTKTISKTDTTTNIKLDTTTDIVPADTKLIVNKVTEGKSYIDVEQALGSNVSKFELYDISLVSNNATIQPNGKVKISIPVPNGYDTSKLVVYRIAEDGTKTKYETTISNGYITFETDHFSNYVVAEESTTTSTETPTETDNTTTPTTSTNNKQLDNTPKTGAESYTTIISTIVSTICALGLAVIKRI